MAAVDYFLKLTGIDGESLDKTHKDSIEIQSWSWGESNQASHSTTGIGAGKVVFQDFSFAMKTNKASPKLLLYCANGEHITEALLTCRRAGKEQQEYLKIKLTECVVTSYQTGGNAGDVVPIDSVTLAFTKIEYSYAPQTDKGGLGTALPVHWSVQEHTGG